ncbi:zinc finger protein 383-like [Pseudophryne corroboree]|uniref:zinc finger protein 383-like n=1 Tax=Pseudophryne corroboree TaxID=495146 RepID=UPI0030814785
MPNCIVKGCPHKTGRKLEYPSVTLHGFPNNIPEIKKWLLKTGQNFGDLDEFAEQVLEKKKSDVYCMCSEHFTVGSYIRKGSKIYLKKGAVPSIFEPFVGFPTIRRREDLDQVSNAISSLIPTVSLTNRSRYIDKCEKEGNNRAFAGSRCLKKDSSTQTEDISKTNNGQVAVRFSMLNNYLHPCAPSNPVNVQPMFKEQYAHALLDLKSKEEILFKESTKAPLPESSCATKKVEASINIHESRASEEISILVEKKEDLTSDRKVIVFESCLDQLFLKLCSAAHCLCKSPIKILEKKMDGLELVVNAICTSGHKFELWSNQPRKGDMIMGTVPLSEPILLSSSTQKSQFDEVAVHFSKEEWDSLKTEEKEIYWEVMIENYQTLRSLGRISVIPQIVSMIERGEEPYVIGPSHSEKENPVVHSMVAPVRAEPPLTRSSGVSQCGGPIGDAQNENVEKREISQECEEAFLEKRGLPDYVIPTHMEECPDCGKLFLYKSYLTRHQRTHTGEKPYPCTECDKCFTDRSSLAKHQRTHGIGKVFVCPDCEKCFGLKLDLIKHQAVHKEEYSFICSVCGESFLDYFALGRHKSSHKATFHLCPICGKCFSNPSHLLIHRKIHKGEQPYSCTECGECFKNNFDLVKHKQTRPSVKRFPCSECGKCFTQTSSLYAHRRLHLGAKPYSCPECGRCFAKKSSLIKHRRLHTGEKPFSCFEYGKCFAVHSNLVKHQQLHTREKRVLYS